MNPSTKPSAAGPLLFWIRPDGRMLNASQAGCQWLGYSLDELRTLYLWDVDPDFPRDRWPEHWRELQVAESLNFPGRHRHRDGRVSEVEVFAHYFELDGVECVSAAAYPLSPEQRAERALRENEARLTLALEVSGQALYELDLLTGKALLSDAYVDLLGRDPSALEADFETWIGWVHPEDRDIVMGLYQDCVSGRISEYKDVDFRWRSDSGVYKWLRSVGRVVERDQTGRPLRLVGTHLDITNSKEAEEALRLTQVAVDRAVVGIYWFDAAGRIVYVNDEACRSLGYSREELIGATTALFVPEFTAQRYAQLWDELLTAGSATFETQPRRKDGESFIVEVACNRISVGDKEFNVAFARDVTARKAAEAKLKDSESRYRAVFDNSLDAIIVHDAEGGILAVNQAMLEMFGLERAEALRCTTRDLSGTADPETLSGIDDTEPGTMAFCTSVLSGEIRHLEWTAKQPKSGKCFPVEITLRSIQFGDRPAIMSNLRDISERKRAEEALRESEERFATAFRRSPAPTTISDLETGRFIDVNDRWLSTTGFTREEVIGRTTDEFVHVADRAILGPALEEIARRGTVLDYPVPVVRKDGEPRDYLWSAQKIRLRGQEVLLSSIQDVTERNRAQAALRQSEERFAKAFQSSPAAMLVSTIAEGRIIDVNERWLSLLGYSREGMIGRTTKQIGIWERPTDRDRMIAQLRETGPFQDAPIVFRTFSDERREILWSTEIITSGDERVLLSSVHDLTPQKRAERALQESEARLRTAVESIPFDFYVLDAERRFVLQNRVSKARLGDLIGQHSSQLPVDRDLLDRFEGMLDRALAGELIDQESPIMHAGEERHVHDVIAPVQDASGARGVVGLSIDVTERRRAEAELQRYREHLEELVQERTETLQHAMRQLVQAEKLAALGNLVAGVAHELNTPLGNARMVASTLGDDVSGLAADLAATTLRRSQLTSFLERAQEAVGLLERNTARAADLIGHFKEVAVDQTSVRRRCFNLGQTIEEMLSTLYPRLKRTAHRIELAIPPDIELDSHPGPLEQVLTNLIENSLSHGFVDTDAGAIKIEAHAIDAERIKLAYSDNGVGIAPDARARIFDPFYTTRLGQGGSGLGLYIVYNLVTGLLGGAIEVTSPPDDAGVSFCITLPLKAPERTSAEL